METADRQVAASARPSRRGFLRTAGAAAGAALFAAPARAADAPQPPRPNILWITTEDMSPN
ncbi:MAG: twin-arginine translocation signal domain-containing protein, partial [Planctomycetota bacterium]